MGGAGGVKELFCWITLYALHCNVSDHAAAAASLCAAVNACIGTASAAAAAAPAALGPASDPTGRLQHQLLELLIAKERREEAVMTRLVQLLEHLAAPKPETVNLNPLSSNAGLVTPVKKA